MIQKIHQFLLFKPMILKLITAFPVLIQLLFLLRTHLVHILVAFQILLFHSLLLLCRHDSRWLPIRVQILAHPFLLLLFALFLRNVVHYLMRTSFYRLCRFQFFSQHLYLSLQLSHICIVFFVYHFGHNFLLLFQFLILILEQLNKFIIVIRLLDQQLSFLFELSFHLLNLIL